VSHVAVVDVEIKSLDDLAKACKALGLEYDREATKWVWFGSWYNDFSRADAAFKHGIAPERYGKADAGVIKIPGATYSIGVYAISGQPGKYTLVYDNWQGGKGIEKVLGAGLPKLRQEYAAQVSQRKMQQAGFQVQRRKLDNGQIKLVCRR